MKKLNLARIQVVGGVAYGPGEVEVDEAVAKRLKGVAPASTTTTQSKEGGGSDGLPEGFPFAQILTDAGFDSVEKVKAASDEQLIAIDGIAEGRLKEIRKAAK